jgi:hypothetical protein
MPPARLAPVLLGAFVVWQLVFLLAANAIRFVRFQSAEGPAPPVLAGAGAAADGWAALTGQHQAWNLFAPMAPVRALFVAVRADGPAGRWTTPSPFEPDGEGRYFHPPGSGDRLWHAEKEVSLPYLAWDPVETARRPAEWRDYLHGRLRDRWRGCHAYLAWQRGRWLRAHPGGPEPAEFTLLVVAYSPSRGPQRPALPEATLEVVRWRPAAAAPAGRLPLEVRDGAGWTFLTEKPGGDAP